MTSLEAVATGMAIGLLVWLTGSLLFAWAWSRWKRSEHEQDRLDAWRRQERLRWTRR